MRILICAGGTGGHIYPALATASELIELGVPREEILWLGVQGEMEGELVPRAGLALQQLPGGGLAGLPLLTQVKNGMKLVLSTFKANRIFSEFKPQAVLLTGGYINAPVALVAKLRRVPSLVYLPDIEPGSAIQTISRWVSKVATTFDVSKQYFPETPTVPTGYPVRAELEATAQIDKDVALATFDLTPGRPTLFVFGGSRGAWSINQALMGILPELLQFAQVIHVSGTFTWDQVSANADSLPEALRQYYRPYPYLHEEMGAGFRAADLVVARAGASMLGESPLFGVPAILVPYPYAWRYQKVNADYLAERQAAIRLNDEDLTTQLLPLLRQLLVEDRSRLAEMAAAVAKLHIPHAARNIATQLLQLGEASQESNND